MFYSFQSILFKITLKIIRSKCNQGDEMTLLLACFLAWRISWTEEPSRLHSMGLQRVRHDWMTNTFPFFNTKVANQCPELLFLATILCGSKLIFILFEHAWCDLTIWKIYILRTSFILYHLCSSPLFCQYLTNIFCSDILLPIILTQSWSLIS